MLIKDDQDKLASLTLVLPIRTINLIEDICRDILDKIPENDKEMNAIIGNNIVADQIIHGFAHTLDEKDVNEHGCKTLGNLLNGDKWNYVDKGD